MKQETLKILVAHKDFCCEMIDTCYHILGDNATNFVGCFMPLNEIRLPQWCKEMSIDNLILHQYIKMSDNHLFALTEKGLKLGQSFVAHFEKGKGYVVNGRINYPDAIQQLCDEIQIENPLT